MRSLTFMLSAAFGVLAGPALAAEPQPAPQQVIELYQSQGCSSCPPANAVLNSLADRKDLITGTISAGRTASPSRPSPSARGTMPRRINGRTCRRRKW